ncbi:MAG TPA: MotA/TolQ/ExbB proton channel family protein [Candidatus Omnitrophota bacterium]|nr:MotA/TolQ/ExbB proton channel family protein [Candidatus Omnitrophota bacterium]
MRKILQTGFVLLSLFLVLIIFNKIQVVRAGGPVMVLILFSSISAVAVIIEKYIQFSSESIKSDILIKNISESIERQRIKEAIDYCDRTDTSIARVLKAGIMKYDRPKEEIKEAMQDAFDLEMPLLEDKLPVIDSMIQIIPLFGFLGTLTGLVRIFNVFSSRLQNLSVLNNADLIPGMWQALISSMSAFMVVVPVLLAFNYLNCKLNAIEKEIEFASTKLLNFLIDRRMP